VSEFSHYDSKTRRMDVALVLHTINSVPDESVFILQGYCHNPTGADSTQEWTTLANAIEKERHLPFLDFAYQGLASGLDQGVFSVRLFARMEIEMLVYQSFSKNFALYGERCGALHVVARSASAAQNLHD
jgi:aspartate aminotransferase